MTKNPDLEYNISREAVAEVLAARLKDGTAWKGPCYFCGKEAVEYFSSREEAQEFHEAQISPGNTWPLVCEDCERELEPLKDYSFEDIPF